MTAFDVAVIILVSLALAARLAGAKFFEIVDDFRARADGFRCRIASWSFTLVLGIVLLLTKDYEMPVRIAGGVLSFLSAGGVVWEVFGLMAFFTEKQSE